MNIPKPPAGANINTWLTLAGFALTFIFGYGAYKSFESETRAWRTETAVQIAELKAQRSVDNSRLEGRANSLEVSINNLNIQDARQIEQITSMLNYLQRIERTLDKLVEEETP